MRREIDRNLQSLAEQEYILEGEDKMTIYWILVLAILIIGFPMQPHLSKKRAKAFLWIAFLMLFVVSGFRAYSVGADTRTYINLFQHIESENFADSRYEIGFLIYVSVLYSLSKDPGVLLIVSSVICIGSACLLSYYFSKNPILSMMLYILLGSYFSQMNIMRQAIAMSIIEIAFILLTQKNQKITAAILIVLATTFHTVAYMGFLPYILVIQNNRDKPQKPARRHEKVRTGEVTAYRMLGYTIIIAFIAFAGYSFMMFLVETILPDYTHYFFGDWSDANYNASLFNMMIQLTFAVVGAIIFGKKALDKPQRMAAIMLSLSIVFYALSMRMEIWNRVAGLFGIYTYLVWAPAFTSEIYKAHERFLVNTVIVAFSAAYMLIVLVYRPEWTWVVPYYFR